MEYPFKELQPLDEVAARTGYYRDWSHIDADNFHQISELATFIREKGYGADTREAIAQALERVYHDALISGNANMEVSMARNNFTDLASRLDASDDKLSSARTEVAGARGGFVTLGDRLNREVFDMSRMGQDVKEAMTGGSVAVVGENAVDTLNVIDEAITNAKLSHDFEYNGIVHEGSINSLIGSGTFIVNSTVTDLPSTDGLLLSVRNFANRFTQTAREINNPSSVWTRTGRISEIASVPWEFNPAFSEMILVDHEKYIEDNPTKEIYDYMSAIREIEVIGVSPEVPVKIWMLCRNWVQGDAPWNYRIMLSKKENGVWSRLADSGSGFIVSENPNGFTSISFTSNGITFKARVNYNMIPQGGRLLQSGAETSDPYYVVPPSKVFLKEEDIKPDVETYDQQLNTFDNVGFASVKTDALEVSGDIPTGTLASPPIGVLSGDMWADTTDSVTHPIVRIML